MESNNCKKKNLTQMIYIDINKTVFADRFLAEFLTKDFDYCQKKK